MGREKVSGAPLGQEGEYDPVDLDLLHTGSGVFACPPGCKPSGFLGEGLFA